MLTAPRSAGIPSILVGPLLLSAAAPAAFCLWDRDTLKMEAAGAPGVAEAIVGRFDQFPDLYYEMRLARVAKEIETSPSDLSLYDDAAVAVERLGRSDEAIEWMARKRRLLDEQDGDLHHEYTYLANLGTFHVHRWLHAGAPRDALADLELGRDHLAAALDLNPDAHFGRERWQLMAVEALIDPPPTDEKGFRTFLPGDGRLYPGGHKLEALGYSDAVEGLTGLITLGEAWKSIDVFRALFWALEDQGDAHLAELARLRIRELLNLGKQSLMAPEAHDWKVQGAAAQLYNPNREEVHTFFSKARVAAETWREEKNAYLMERLVEGRHPDTDADFWEAWEDAPALPRMGGIGLVRWLRRDPLMTIPKAALLAAAVIAAGAYLRRWYLSRKRRHLQWTP